jgi:hypothetical protein
MAVRAIQEKMDEARSARQRKSNRHREESTPIGVSNKAEH